MSQLKVIKRDGSIVPYDLQRIRAAVSKAMKAASEDYPDRIESVVTDVDAQIRSRHQEERPSSVEQIQDIVERCLMTHQLFQTAKAYILYRQEHAKMREQQRSKVIEAALRGQLKVTKRDGTLQAFDSEKISRSLKRACAGIENDVEYDEITKEFLKSVFDGISTRQIEEALVFAAVAFVERDPAYDAVASRLYMTRIAKEVLGVSIDQETYVKEYRAAFINGIHEGIRVGLLDPRMSAFALDDLAVFLVPQRDDFLTYMGLQTLYERYLLKRSDQRRLELPQSFWMRIAMGLSLNEPDKMRAAQRFYTIMSQLLFVPSTPTLFHAGTRRPQLSSCYITKVDDDLQHIFKCLGDNAQYSKWSGGLGNDWTSVRATGARISSTGVESQGVIPFLKIANDVTMAINRSGKRRGATCAYLETWHLDIEDFLDLRRNTGDERRRTHDMSTANWIPDLFMKRVREKANWTLFSPEEVPDLHDLYGSEFEERYLHYEREAAAGRMRKTRSVDAVTLWRKMLTRLFETGHPWITFKDPCNVRSPQDHVGVIHSSNLCTEITLNTSSEETAVCNLGSVNLSRHVTPQGIDEELLAATVGTAIRMLDNVIDLNFYPTAESRESNLRHRPIGLGVMGLQDALFALRIPFDAPTSISFNDAVMETISYYAILASAQLAAERGAYSSFKGSKWDRGILPRDTVKLLERERGISIPLLSTPRLDWEIVRDSISKFGMRNSNCLAIAPTATIATIAGCYPSIEPIYKNLYVKSNISGEFTIVNRFLIADLKTRGLWSDQMLEKIKFHDGVIDPIPEIPSDLKALYREAFQVDPMAVIACAAVRGHWIDQSQSLNLFVRGTSGKILDQIYMTAWECGLKTTYYLRTLAASQIEKSTLDSKYGFTQKRRDAAEKEERRAPQSGSEPRSGESPIRTGSLCSLLDPECESCQ